MELKAIENGMRAREPAHEQAIDVGASIVVRLNGRGFSTLSRALKLEKPFDDGFRDYRVATARHLDWCASRLDSHRARYGAGVQRQRPARGAAPRSSTSSAVHGHAPDAAQTAFIAPARLGRARPSTRHTQETVHQ